MVGHLAKAGPASAEGAWVLWSQAYIMNDGEIAGPFYFALDVVACPPPSSDQASALVCLPSAFGLRPRSADRPEGRVVEGAPLRSRASPSRRRLTGAAGGAIVAPGGAEGTGWRRRTRVWSSYARDGLR
jgi:hypothetical protein